MKYNIVWNLDQDFFNKFFLLQCVRIIIVLQNNNFNLSLAEFLWSMAFLGVYKDIDEIE